MLRGSDRPLAEHYDVAMLDLDGVVYIGGEAVPGAADHLAAARGLGMRLAFITNNASRPAAQVSAHLERLGIEAPEHDVVTSAQAAAKLLAADLDAGATVVNLGGSGLSEALVAVGLVPVGVEDAAVAIVSGYGPELRWADLMRAAVRIREGLPWVASNTDMSIPTPYGTAPGHGVLVDTVRRFTGVEPRVAGKPERPLLDETIERMSAERPLMVGDRVDTDIRGGHNAGSDTLLVMTGVTGLTELVAIPPEDRPTYVAAGLDGLNEPHGVPDEADGTWTLGGWTWRGGDEPRVEGAGGVSDWWRLVAAAGWAESDTRGEPPSVDHLSPPVASAA